MAKNIRMRRKERTNLTNHSTQSSIMQVDIILDRLSGQAQNLYFLYDLYKTYIRYRSLNLLTDLVQIIQRIDASQVVITKFKFIGIPPDRFDFLELHGSGFHFG